MKSLFQHPFFCLGLALFLLIVAPCAPAWAQVEPTSISPTTFVFFQRTSGHMKYSTPEVFQQAVDDIQEFLRANGIATVPGTNVSSSGGLPFWAVQEMARDSNAAYLLYVVVDRPGMKWLKVTVQCYDAMGHEIWQEQSFAGREREAHNALQKLRDELNKRLGQPGLLQAPSQRRPPLASTDNPVASAQNREASGETLRLASGTPVHLLVAESVSSKTAKPGDTVKLQVLGDVKVGDLVVIANKAPASGTIETTQNARRAWRAGRMVLKLQTVMMLNQQQQALRAWNAVKGKDTNAGAVWLDAVHDSAGFALLLLPFAPLQHGNQAFLYRGTVLEAVIDGDVLLPRGAIEAAQPKPAEPRRGPASVTFYYQDFGHGYSVDVWCGDVKVGHLRRGGKFTLALPVGRYWLRQGKRDREITLLDVEGGGEDYVRVTVSRHPRASPRDDWWVEHLSVVLHDIGEAQSANTTSAKSQHVLDVAKLDLAQLQAGTR